MINQKVQSTVFTLEPLDVATLTTDSCIKAVDFVLAKLAKRFDIASKFNTSNNMVSLDRDVSLFVKAKDGRHTMVVIDSMQEALEFCLSVIQDYYV